MDLDALRAATPGCGYRIHLNNAGAALMSQPTLDAMTGHLRLEAEVGGYEAMAAEQDAIDDTYAALATLLGGQRHEIALFDNSTHAWNAAFYSIPLGPGDRILTGVDEYGSAALAYMQVAKRTGAELVVVPNDADGQLDVEALERLVDERTRVIGLTWVPTSGGLVNPAAEVGRVARRVDALYLLDATQVVGQFPVDVASLGCDVLTGTGRKFLRGPRGTGFLWVRDEALPRLDPFVAEIESATWTGGLDFTWWPGAARFASWEQSCVSVLGMRAAVRQALDLGLDAIGARATALGTYLRDRLGAIPGVTTHDLGVRKCAIVTAKVAGRTAEEVQAELARQGINVTTTVAVHNQFDTLVRDVHPLVRFSPHYYNTSSELDEAIRAVERLAQENFRR